MTNTTEIVVISILALLAAVLVVVVVFLVRWLLKVAFAGVDPRTGERRFAGNDSDSESSMVDDISIFAPSEGGGDQAWESAVVSTKHVGLSGSPSKPHDPFDDFDPDPDRTSPGGGWNPLHTGQPHPSVVINSVFSDAPFSERGVISPARPGGITFGFYRIVQGRKVTKSLFLSKADVSQGLGIVLKGDAPVSICEVEGGGPSWKAGLRLDDVITSVNGTPCVNSSHKAVIALVSRALQKVQSDSSSQRGVRGHAMSMVVTAQDARPDAAISDVNISLPGQAWGEDGASVSKAGGDDGTGDDPFAPIREAASQHQLEAARLMQTGNFKQARILLDRAIELLQSIPKSQDSSPQKSSPPKGPHGSPRRKGESSGSGAGKSTKRRPKKQKENRGFVPWRAGAKKADMVSLLSKRTAISPMRPARVRAAKPWRATIITTSHQIPSASWKPIKAAKLSKRRNTTARRKPSRAHKASSSRAKGAAASTTSGSTKRSGPSATRASVNGAPMPSAAAWGAAAFGSTRGNGGFGGFELNAPSKRNSYGDANEAYGFRLVGVD